MDKELVNEYSCHAEDLKAKQDTNRLALLF